jgi:hypothetical protein
MSLVKEMTDVERWVVPGEFNPRSPDQIIAFMNHIGMPTQPGKKSKTGKPSTEENALKKLARKNCFFKTLLEFRKIDKLKTTYVDPNLSRLDKTDRIHPQFLHKPKTWRLSSAEPNWQNIPKRDMDDDEDSLTKDFRRCIVPAADCVLVEADYAGIEAVQTGWFCNDPDYIRLAKYGIHSYLTSHKVGDPADLSWPEDRLAAHLAHIKKKHQDTPVYFGFKRTVHLTNYGGGPWMMNHAAPDIFPTIKAAKEAQDFYFELVPKLRDWQKKLRERAAKENFLGGRDHPYKFRHWFWDVVTYDKNGKQKPGADWNKVVSFYPQSTAAGNLYDATLRLSDPQNPYYVGDLYHGQTPIRALIHDSILAEVPKAHLVTFLERLTGSMLEPIRAQPLDPTWCMGDFLTIGVDVKVGSNWGDMVSP